MKCVVCSAAVEVDEPHLLRDCAHAFHLRCLDGGLPSCAHCPVAQANGDGRGEYNVDVGGDAPLSRHLMRAAQLSRRVAATPPETGGVRRLLRLSSAGAGDSAWTLVGALASGEIKEARSVMECPIAYDHMAKAGVTLQHLVACGLSERAAVTLGYSEEALAAGATWPGPGGNRVLPTTDDGYLGAAAKSALNTAVLRF